MRKIKDFLLTDIKVINKVDIDTLVNKNIRLEKEYVPNDLELLDIKYACKDKYLRKEAKIFFEKMAEFVK